MSDLNPHGHATIGEVGECAACRPGVIADVRETYGYTSRDDFHLFHDFLLQFKGEDGADQGWAVVPAPDLDTAIENAWACGCNPGGHLGGGPILRGLADRAGVPTCVLLVGPAAKAAADAMDAAYRASHEDGA